MSEFRVIESDCIEAMAAMPESSVDAIVTDPPYGLEFMGKDWDRPSRMGKVSDAGDADGTPFRRNAGTPSWSGSGNPSCLNCGGGKYDRNDAKGCRCDAPRFPNHAAVQMRAFQAWSETWATEAFRILKPGGHLLAFGGTRTSHRLVCAIEDAGFEVRDSLLWLYGSGFPKSLDVSKAIDKRKRREYVTAALALGLSVPGRNLDDWTKEDHAPGDKWWEEFKDALAPEDWQRIERAVIGEVVSGNSAWFVSGRGAATAPATPDAERWQGWGTALKPAHEPIVMARKPLIGTVAANVAVHGTGPLNIDACRIEGQPRDPGNLTVTANGNGITHGHMTRDPANYVMPSGRWPANVLLDEEAAALLDAQTGECRSAGEYIKGAREQGAKIGPASIPVDGLTSATYSDAGGASRFFYVAKASSAERNAGLNGFEVRETRTYGDLGPDDNARPNGQGAMHRANVHPTVKPIDLMRWLCRLVTPPGGTVLDPFTGSGTTGCAAALEGFDFIGIEREAEYAAIARARIAHWWAQPVQLGLEAA